MKYTSKPRPVRDSESYSIQFLYQLWGAENTGIRKCYFFWHFWGHLTDVNAVP
jgi:hypothetical protein